MKFCKDCKYYSEKRNAIFSTQRIEHRCHHPKNKYSDWVTGCVRLINNAHEMRQMGGECGMEAILFEPKEIA